MRKLLSKKLANGNQLLEHCNQMQFIQDEGISPEH